MAAGAGKGVGACATTSSPAWARRPSSSRRCAAASKIGGADRGISWAPRAAPSPRFEQPAFRAMSAAHTWPLNVRELEKIVTTAAVLTGGASRSRCATCPSPIARAITAPAAPGIRRSTGPSPTPAQLEELLRR